MHGSVPANFAANECDLLIALGVRFDDRVTGPPDTFAVNSKIIHVDIDGRTMSDDEILAMSFVLFLGGLTPIAWEQAPLLASAYVGAWLIGYLTLLAPTGIGVREGVLVFLVGNEIGFAAATVAALGYRILIALRDLVVALIGARMAPASPPADSERR
jgi:hypothetical protein